MARDRRACFFARVKDKAVLDSRQWYANDIRILRDIGYEVVIATSFREIPSDCDLYFSWWATGSVFPLIKAKLFRKPIVVVAGGREVITAQELGYQPDHCYSSKPFYVQAAIRFCLRSADAVLAVSQRVLSQVRELGAKNPFLVYNAVDTELFSPRREEAALQDVLAVSDLSEATCEVKNVETVLSSIPHVLQECPDVRFVILGEKADAYARIERLVENLRVEQHVTFAGRVPNEEVRNYLTASKVFVQISKYETFGVAIAEAMATGVPVVVSDVGAVREVVGDCGLYADHTSPGDVADKLVMLLKDDARRQELSIAGRRRIEEKFSYAIRRERISEILDLLMH